MQKLFTDGDLWHHETEESLTHAVYSLSTMYTYLDFYKHCAILYKQFTYQCNSIAQAVMARVIIKRVKNIRTIRPWTIALG